MRKLVARAVLSGLAVLVLVLGAGGAQAATVVVDPGDTTKAIGIDNLEINGALFNVDFTDQQSAAATYGPFPGTLFLFLDLPDKAEAIADTMDLINEALNLHGGILGVGADTPLPGGFNNYFMGWQSQLVVPGGPQIIAWDSGPESGSEDGIWAKNTSSTFQYNDDTSTAWAVLTQVPEPGSALLGAVSLSVLGVLRVLRRSR